VSITRNELKNLRALKTKKGRREQALFIAEGIRILEEALRFKIVPKTVFYCPEMINLRAEPLLKQFQKLSVRLNKLPAKDFEAISDAETPQGVLATISVPESDLKKLYRRSYRRILLCEHLADPGNLGTLLRSAAAFGFGLVILTGSSVEPYSPKVVRSTVGGLFSVKIARSNLTEIAELIREEQIRLVAADSSGKSLRKGLVAGSTKIMLALGSEAHGLSADLMKLAKVRIRIMHTDRVESLNVAVAGSILMKDIYELSDR